MAGMIFRVDTFFKGTDNFDQLVKIVKVLGEEDLQRYMTKYGLNMPKEVQKLMRGNTYDRKPWTSFINEKNQHLVSDDALDLLNKMLQYDKNLRIRPREAMAHKYFDPIREFVKQQEERGED